MKIKFKPEGEIKMGAWPSNSNDLIGCNAAVLCKALYPGAVDRIEFGYIVSVINGNEDEELRVKVQTFPGISITTGVSKCVLLPEYIEVDLGV
jgi:hypothetical protein